MPYQKALKIIFVIGIAGMLFSGYLSYYELFVPEGCSEAVVNCGEKNVTIATLPACVYGFVMYAIVLGISGFSLWKGGENKAIPKKEKLESKKEQ